MNVRFKKFYGTIDAQFKMPLQEGKNFHEVFRKEESFHVIAYGEDGATDHILAGIQFRRGNSGVFINYIGTTAGTVEASVYGSKKYFLPAGTHFRGMGLSLLLLRVVQMYQACCGGSPNLFIQLKVSSHLYTYLNNHGFKEVHTYDETHDTESNNLTLAFEAFQEEIDMDRDRGCVLREAREGYVTLGLMEVAYLNSDDGRWKRPVINSWENYYTENKKWLENVTMFHFPFQTDGRYIDQCAKGLLCLGTPFYYARDPTRLNACRKVNPMLQHIIMDGKHYEDLNRKTLELSTKWLTSEHIQFVTNITQSSSNFM